MLIHSSIGIQQDALVGGALILGEGKPLLEHPDGQSTLSQDLHPLVPQFDGEDQADANQSPETLMRGPGAL